MTRTEVFDTLAARGVSRAMVYFSGGNDEGFVDVITLEGSTGIELARLEESWDPKTPDDFLATALAKPVYDSFGSFAGEFYVSSRFVWHAGDRTVLFEGREVPEGKRIWEY